MPVFGLCVSYSRARLSCILAVAVVVTLLFTVAGAQDELAGEDVNQSNTIDQIIRSEPDDQSTLKKNQGIPDLLATVFPDSAVCLADDFSRQKFEAQIPGQWPEGWIRLWGDSKEDSFAITNYIRLFGSQALQLNRQEKNMYGLSCKLQSVPIGGCVFLGFAFQIEGPGNQVALTIELRQGTQRGSELGFISFVNRSILVNGGKGNHKTQQILGKYDEKQWYVFLASIPSDAGKKAELVLMQPPAPTENGLWQEIGRKKIETVEALNCPVFFSITTGPALTGYTFAIDDLCWAVLEKTEQATTESEPAGK